MPETQTAQAPEQLTASEPELQRAQAPLPHGWVRSSERLPIISGEDFWKDHGQVEVATACNYSHLHPSGRGRSYAFYKTVCQNPLAYPFWRKPLRISDYPPKSELMAGHGEKPFVVAMRQETGGYNFFSLVIYRVPLDEHKHTTLVPEGYVVMQQRGYTFDPEHAEQLQNGIAFMQTYCDKMNEYPRLHTPPQLLCEFYPEEFGYEPLAVLRGRKGVTKR